MEALHKFFSLKQLTDLCQTSSDISIYSVISYFLKTSFSDQNDTFKMELKFPEVNELELFFFPLGELTSQI